MQQPYPPDHFDDSISVRSQMPPLDKRNPETDWMQTVERLSRGLITSGPVDF